MPLTSFIPLPLRTIFRIVTQRGFFLTHRLIALPYPVHDCGIIGHQLALFIISMTGLSLIAELHFHPIFDIDHRRLGFPVALTFTHDLKFLTKPIDGIPHQLIGKYRFMNSAQSIRQLA